ncbi:Putative 30S ribosomal protein S15 [Rhizopus microsporus]|nr:Putative 30S ribosomal protein S15 [Rhizopus microsporus]
MLSRLSSCRSATSSVFKHEFHSSAASFAKKHPKQVKKENLAKRAAKIAELERTKPSVIVSRPAPFFETLLTPADAYQQHKTGYMHFLDEKDQQFLFEETPKKVVEASHIAAVDGMESALKQEQGKVETLQKILKYFSYTCCTRGSQKL